jgi:polyisoprenoid-binding protein YceI
VKSPTGTFFDVSRYVLDKSASSFTVRAFPNGILASFGHSPTIAIRDFSGEASFSPDHPGEASLQLRIRADSLEVTDDIKSSDRREIESTMKRTVLETQKYPEISFESTRVAADPIGDGMYRANITGNLTLHGVMHSVSVPAQVMVSGDRQVAFGEFSLVQSRFGIKPVSVAGGVLKLKDELKFRFNIVARAQD